MPIRSSYELSKLFLALSDVSRLDILNQLSEQVTVIDISRRFGLLVHEAERQLRRLADVGLVVQLPNGDYVMSEYGKVLVPFIEGISEVHDLLEYWERHSADELPPHLQRLPADLSEWFIPEEDQLRAAASKIVREALSFLWVLNYPVDQAVVKAAEFKVLQERTENTLEEERKTVRYVEGVKTILLVNEFKALICFPKAAIRDGCEPDPSSGFLVETSSVAYRLLVELFASTWRAHEQQS
jgi:DNA-binding transcriptional ArsR family regulator